MQISYKQLSGGSYAVIIDTTAAPTSFDTNATGTSALVAFSPQFKPSTQKQDLASPQTTPSTPSFRAPRGNITTTLNFSFNVPYGSLANAIAAIRTYSALLNTQWHLRVVEGSETQYYPNAIMDDYGAEVQGASVLHRMVWISDLVTTSAP